MSGTRRERISIQLPDINKTVVFKFIRCISVLFCKFIQSVLLIAHMFASWSNELFCMVFGEFEWFLCDTVTKESTTE